MDDASIASPATATPKTPIILLAAQWIVASFLAWIAIRSMLEAEDFISPAVLFWPTIAFVSAVALAHAPPVFFSVSIGKRYGIYGATVLALLALGTQQKPRPQDACTIFSRSLSPAMITRATACSTDLLNWALEGGQRD